MIQLIPQDEVVSISQWKLITKSYKYEMKPTKKQEVLSNQTLSTCRHLYNDLLGERKEGWKNGGWNVNYYDQKSHLVILKNTKNSNMLSNDHTGQNLKNVQSQILQNVVQRVDRSYDNFFRRVKNNKTDSGKYEKPGFPRFKGYGQYDSFTFPQYGNGCNIIDRKGKKNDKGDIIRLSKIGDIKFIKHREIGDPGIPCQIKICTVKKEIDKLFVIFTVDTFVEIEIPIIQKQITIDELNSKSIGIDMGLSNLVTLSNGKKIEPPEYLRESEKILTKHQRRLSRKQRYEKEILDERESKKQKKEVKKKIKVNSKNREKERIKVAKIHRKIVNQRRNFNHEVSRTLIDNFDLISFEKLSIQNMVKNHRLAKSISDASWYQLQTFTSYKAEWAGKIVDFVDPKYTSQNCSKCGKLVGRVTEGDIFKCPFCGLTINVHINAANNIRDRSVEYQRMFKELNIESTPATGGRACLNSPEVKDVMIQEALSNKKGEECTEISSIQALPFRDGVVDDSQCQ